MHQTMLVQVTGSAGRVVNMLSYLICTDIRAVSDNTGLMLDYGWAEESRLRWIVLRNLVRKKWKISCLVITTVL
jgi:hypothetical protein